jgi:hypothetical protein
MAAVHAVLRIEIVAVSEIGKVQLSMGWSAMKTRIATIRPRSMALSKAVNTSNPQPSIDRNLEHDRLGRVSYAAMGDILGGLDR